MSLIPDEYEVRARLKPVLLVSLPPTLAAMSWFPDLSGMQFLVGLLAAFGFVALLAQLGRDQGKQFEPWLYKQWGGMPSAQLLRHRDSRLAPETKRRYHEVLTQLVPQLCLPSAATEAADMYSADSSYESCSAFLRERTRDKKVFPLVFAENVNYGFRRNLWSMRRAGVTLCLLALVASAAAAIALRKNGLPPVVPTVAMLLSASLLVWWLLRIKPTWVQVAAYAYAERLLSSCETICPERSTRKHILTDS
jgi:hypothetical protein